MPVGRLEFCLGYNIARILGFFGECDGGGAVLTYRCASDTGLRPYLPFPHGIKTQAWVTDLHNFVRVPQFQLVSLVSSVSSPSPCASPKTYLQEYWYCYILQGISRSLWRKSFQVTLLEYKDNNHVTIIPCLNCVEC